MVCVNDNAAANTIAAFARRGDGTLVPMPGSPFAAGAAGGSSWPSARGAARSPCSGIATSGELQAVGSPVASGDIKPVSIAVHGHLAYVANEGNGAAGSDYTGFTPGDDDQRAPLADSTVPLAPTALPGDVLFNATGTHLVGTDVGPPNGPSFMDSFGVGADGRLIQDREPGCGSSAGRGLAGTVMVS